MAELGFFNAEEIEPNEAFEVIPNGDYRAVIVRSEFKPTTKGGHFLELVIELLDEPHKGRRVWHRLNLDNPNPKAVEIAKRELSAYCHAVGELQVKDSAQLHDKPFTVKIVAGKRTDNGEPTNEVKGPVLPKKGQSTTQSVGPQTQASAPAGSGAAPWQR